MDFKPLRLAAFPIAAAILMAASAGFPAPAEAGGKRYGNAYGGKYDARDARARSGSRSYGWRGKRRGRAIFSSDVDLSAPGGTKRYFELLSEEIR